ncbi:hypothetical protein [Saccharothrix sp. NRRL B-16348]|uniref:hypothetical protein n=1 Tax=Saccharothrix sp. NRRL B-16348 TaxID=1415542 RepID=UPI0012F8D68C|nr:hypothetical protein [Saccharothrix sp. NRRL B-16348]
MADEETLYRHLHPTHWVRDEGTGGYRVSSAFMSIEAGQDGLSSYAESLLKEHGVRPDEILPEPEYGLVSITAGQARSESCGVVFDPNDELPINFAHMLVKGPNGVLSRGQRRKLSGALTRHLAMLKLPERDPE